MKLINIGYGNMVASERIIAIVSPESAPIKRMIQTGKETRSVIDATFGRKTRSVIVMDSDHIVLSSLQPETITARLKEPKEFEDGE